MIRKPVGIVVCGGRSTRMGMDKSLLVYHEKPQRYRLYDVLKTICSEVWLSCNAGQASDVLPGFPVMTDAPEFAGNGPIAALLTAGKLLGAQDYLLAGCDYPFVSGKDLADFLYQIDPQQKAAAFFNREGWYEPLLGWYAASGIPQLKHAFDRGQTSLQSFLKENNAQPYYPQNAMVMKSADTLQEYEEARRFLSQNPLS